MVLMDTKLPLAFYVYHPSLRKYLTDYISLAEVFLFLAADRKDQTLEHSDDDADKQWKLIKVINESCFQFLLLQKIT